MRQLKSLVPLDGKRHAVENMLKRTTDVGVKKNFLRFPDEMDFGNTKTDIAYLKNDLFGIC